MSPLAQYRAHRLADPIALGFGLGFRAMLFVGTPVLILLSLYAALAYSGPLRGVGLFGLLFCGAAFAFLYLAWRRAEAGAAMRLDEDGIFMAHLGLALPWDRLGPAWTVETRQQYGVGKQAVIQLQDLDGAAAEADLIGRLLLGAAQRAASRSDEAASWGGPTLVGLTEPNAPDPEASLPLIEERLKRLRAAAEAQGATPVGAPAAFHTGLSPDNLVAIVNAETLRRRGMSATDPGQAGPE